MQQKKHKNVKTTRHKNETNVNTMASIKYAQHFFYQLTKKIKIIFELNILVLLL